MKKLFFFAALLLHGVVFSCNINATGLASVMSQSLIARATNTYCYNQYLSCKILSITTLTSGGRTQYGIKFEVKNSGEDAITVSSVIVKDAASYKSLGALEGYELGAGQTKETSISMNQKTDIVFEVVYQHNGSEFHFCSDVNDPANNKIVGLSDIVIVNTDASFSESLRGIESIEVVGQVQIKNNISTYTPLVRVEDKTTLFFDISNLNLTSGSYTVVIPAGTLKTNGELLDEELTFTLSINKQSLASGTYYLKNVHTGKFLSYRGTELTIGGEPLDWIIGKKDNLYTFDSQVGTDDTHYLGDNANISSEECPFVVVEEEANKHMIYFKSAEGNRYLTASENGNKVTLGSANGDFSVWQFITRKELIAELASATEESPIDATFLIQDAGFSKNNLRVNAWEMEAKNQTLHGGADYNNCAESYFSLFTLKQTIKNIPNGTYVLSVQGFYRYDSGTEAAPQLYANGETATLPTITRDAQLTNAFNPGFSKRISVGWFDKYVPNSMSDASQVFDAGFYKTDAITFNVTDRTITLGIKNEKAEGTWVIWDNFSLKCISAESSDIYSPETEPLRGDVDGDGTVTINDITELIKIYLEDN